MRLFGYLHDQLSGFLTDLKLVIGVDLKAGAGDWSSCGGGAAAGQCGATLRVLTALSETLECFPRLFSPVNSLPSPSSILFLICKTSAQPSSGSVGLALSS